MKESDILFQKGMQLLKEGKYTEAEEVFIKMNALQTAGAKASVPVVYYTASGASWQPTQNNY